MDKKQYAVIGLGRFGTSIARRLHEAGQEVLGIDLDEESVEDAETFYTHGVIADSTDEKALRSLGITNFDCIIVAIGDDIQASILTCMLLKNLGLKKIIAKAIGKRHGQVLEAIGVDWIIYPERDMGDRVANQLLSPNTLDYIELSKDHNIEEIIIPSKMVGKNLKELNIRAKFNVSVIAIIRTGDIIVSPSPEELLQREDLLVTIGKRSDLARFSSLND
ncbi:TrkA family potassium uptake protein [Lysinibacillus fusiformis]|uniref:potassium channel family protein n=1 Tax=Lysinibacillus TaxID=400634 RepID=UPI0004D43682|nr:MULTISPECIES: TrkA family potassium uptake protein [Lysinibacillus]MDC6267017.1 TrkA family potassium uptake protein [Lysinibacillus sphaericus]AJK87608.1 potassium uptake system protein [Lysinibacillus fusiformis]KGA80655.1 potassium uptake system protein [Lysinibacillus fusiformis]KHK48826.1 potassium uptake system protein [Lysinibacillus sp. A1]MCE4045780.1 TrkA family potassium uptake protein [Lysinibacillus fusiformis]